MPLTITSYINQDTDFSSKSKTLYLDSISISGSETLITNSLFMKFYARLKEEPTYVYKDLETYLYLDSRIKEYNISLEKIVEYLYREYYLYQEETSSSHLTSLFLNHSKYKYWMNPIKYKVNLSQTETYKTLFIRKHLDVGNIFFKKYSYIMNTCKLGLSFEEEITLLDEFGPRPYGTIPASGTVYNNPLTPVQFNLIDQEGSSVLQSSIYIYVNDITCVSGGNIITHADLGTTTLEKITNQNYLFKFQPNPDKPFSDLHPVVVSGYSVDTHIPANYADFLYSYEVWSYKDIYGYITGEPDVASPYLQNLSPNTGQTSVPVDSNIYMEILDDSTGINPNSVIIEINGEVIVSGSSLISHTFGLATIEPIKGGLGRSYEIDPYNNLPYNQPVNIKVYAEDNYTNAVNILDTSYSFITTSNAHLVVSGLEIYSEGQWKLFNVKESYPIGISTTSFRIKYFNLNGDGVNVLTSKVKLNVVDIPITIEEIVLGTEYLVTFELEPDYTTSAELTFYIEQTLPIYSGFKLFNISYVSILYGVEYCYNSDTKFSYGTEVSVITQVSNLAYKSLQDALVYSFNTLPSPSLLLHGEIRPIDRPSDYMWGFMSSNNPFFEYGKTLNFEVEANDFAGNKLNYKWKLSIESKP